MAIKLRSMVLILVDILYVLLISFTFIMQIREKSWFGCSMKARLQYLDPEQGCPRVNEQPKEFSLDPCAGPVDAFCVLILDPDQV